MPLNIVDFKTKGQVSVLNRWSQTIETKLQEHDRQINTALEQAKLAQPTPPVIATSANAGTNGAVPNQVAGYTVIDINGTKFKLPYFNI